MTESIATRPANMADLCQEAVALHGDDWAKIERHVAQRIEEMETEEKALFFGAVTRIVGFRAPSRFGPTHH